MSHPGEIRTLTAIAEPDVRVWTNVGAAHLEFFPSIDAIADAKAEIFEGARAESVLVANADDQRIVARLSGFAGRIVTFGIDHAVSREMHEEIVGECAVGRGLAARLEIGRLVDVAWWREQGDRLGFTARKRETPQTRANVRRPRHQ
jgi:UDP-N-acetylmuramyl pentapeptide synthase